MRKRKNLFSRRRTADWKQIAMYEAKTHQRNSLSPLSLDSRHDDTKNQLTTSKHVLVLETRKCTDFDMRTLATELLLVFCDL